MVYTATHLVLRQVFSLWHTSGVHLFLSWDSTKTQVSGTAVFVLRLSQGPGCSNSCLHDGSQGLGRRAVDLLEMMNGSWKKEINKLSIAWRSMRHIFRNGIDYLSFWWRSKVDSCLCSLPCFFVQSQGCGSLEGLPSPCAQGASLEDDMSSELANRVDIVLYINPGIE